MASDRDLRISAKTHLTPFMLSHGFREGSGCSYFRVVGDGVYQELSVVPILSGKQARVWVNCFVPELISNKGTKKAPPIGTTIILGGYMSDKGVGHDFGRALIESVDQRLKFLSSLVSAIELHALPYFDVIRCRLDFWNSLPEDDRIYYEANGLKSRILIGDVLDKSTESESF